MRRSLGSFILIGLAVLILAVGVVWALPNGSVNEVNVITESIVSVNETPVPMPTPYEAEADAGTEPVPAATPEPEKIPIIYPDDPDRQARAEKAAEREPMLKAFFMGYPNNDGQVTGGYTEEEIAMEHPHFLQYDLRWGYHPYGTTVIGFTGCAPTAMAMVALELVGDTNVTPDVVADYSTEMGTYVPNSGTSWDFFTKCDEHFGVHGEVTTLSEENMKAQLDEGHPIIMSLGPGDFTQYGHIAVIVDYDDDGFIVNDPGSTIRSRQRWSFDVLAPQIKQVWAYRKA